MKISEIFSSIQGEGSYIGCPATFVRFSGCNLRCRWCDSKYSWEPGYDTKFSGVVDEIKRLGNGIVVFTGGEPLLYPDDIELICDIFQYTHNYHLETNGTIDISSTKLLRRFQHVAISPKLPSARVGPIDMNILECMLNSSRSADLKLVVSDSKDMGAARDLVEDLYETLRRNMVRVILQPNGQRFDYPLALRELVEFVMSDRILKSTRVRILPQLHRIIWGADARGV